MYCISSIKFLLIFTFLYTKKQRAKQPVTRVLVTSGVVPLYIPYHVATEKTPDGQLTDVTDEIYLSKRHLD